MQLNRSAEALSMFAHVIRVAPADDDAAIEARSHFVAVVKQICAKQASEGRFAVPLLEKCVIPLQARAGAD